jgi:hypothetical protein
MALIEEAQQNIVTDKWAIINQASSMKCVKISNFAGRFLNKNFSDLLDDKSYNSHEPIEVDLSNDDDAARGWLPANKDDDDDNSGYNISKSDE